MCCDPCVLFAFETFSQKQSHGAAASIKSFILSVEKNAVYLFGTAVCSHLFVQGKGIRVKGKVKGGLNK